MTTTIAGTTHWQRNLASLIRSGLFVKAEVIRHKASGSWRFTPGRAILAR